MIWVIFTLMIGIAAWFAAAPMLRGSITEPDDGSAVNVHLSQIKEIDSEVAAGLISKDEAAALKVEAQRRLVIAQQTEHKGAPSMVGPAPKASIIIAGIVVAGGVALYAIKGAPHVSSVSRMATTQPAATASATPTTAAPSSDKPMASVEQMIGNLIARLEQDPNDATGWRMLGWSYFNVEKYDDAAAAYGKAIALTPDNAEWRSARGEALVMAAGGFVTPDALAEFTQATALDATDARAQFFAGLALDQAGNAQGAIDIWISQVNEAPPGADWAPQLRDRIEKRAREMDIDISGKLAERSLIDSVAGGASASISTSMPQPSTQEVQSAMAMPAADRQAMIEGMVNGLAAKLADNPDDSEGWIRLIRSRMVLGDPKGAQRDLASALSAFANSPEHQAEIAAEAATLGVTAP